MSRQLRWLPLMAVTALLGAAMLSATYANPSVDTLPKPLATLLQVTPPADEATPANQAEHATPPEETIPPPPDRNSAGLLTVATAVGCGGVVVFLLTAMIILLLRERRRLQVAAITTEDLPPTEEETQRAIRAAVEAGLAELDVADADPRRAVIACWVRLEAAAAAAGTPRERGDTSTDLVGRLLARHAVSETVLADFAGAYREARFAVHLVDERSRGQARAALRQLRDELTAEARHG